MKKVIDTLKLVGMDEAVKLINEGKGIWPPKDNRVVLNWLRCLASDSPVCSYFPVCVAALFSDLLREK